MKSELPMLAPSGVRPPDDGHEGLGYPFRLMAVLGAVLALAVIWLVLPAGRGVTWALTATIALLTLALVWWRTHQLSRAREQAAHMLAALGAATADIPVRLRTRMPLVLVTGDGLPALFDRNAGARFAHVATERSGCGSIVPRNCRDSPLPSGSGATAGRRTVWCSLSRPPCTPAPT